jgi:hypothetical protein
VNRSPTPERNSFLIKKVKLFIIIFFILLFFLSYPHFKSAVYTERIATKLRGRPAYPCRFTLFCCNFFKSCPFVVTFLKVTLFLSVGTHRLPLIRFHLAPPTRFSSLSRPFIYIIAVYLYKLTEKQVR